MTDHVMLDLETLGTKAGCVVLSIGAVRFNPFGEPLAPDDMPQFYRVLDLDDQVANGLAINADTVRWWMKQDVMARAVFDADGTPVVEALRDFAAFCSPDINLAYGPIDGLWANAPSFDCAILRAVADAYAVDFPVKFYREYCMRTLKWQNEALKLGAGNYKFGVNHNAVDDAIGQALFVQRVMGEMNARFSGENAVCKPRRSTDS